MGIYGRAYLSLYHAWPLPPQLCNYLVYIKLEVAFYRCQHQVNSYKCAGTAYTSTTVYQKRSSSTQLMHQSNILQPEIISHDYHITIYIVLQRLLEHMLTSGYHAERIINRALYKSAIRREIMILNRAYKGTSTENITKLQ